MNVLKDSLTHLKPYATLKRDTGIKLDSNEGENYLFPNGIALDLPFERYPDNHALRLKEALASIHGNSPSQYLVGNGSSEILEWLIKSTIGKDDVILTVDPTFVMYKFYATLHECRYESVPLNRDFTFPLEAFKKAMQTLQPKLIILCSPNNPTGGLIPDAYIEEIIALAPGMVLLDEAYIEFASGVDSWITRVDEFPHLIVTRTFSKAYGLASIRLGFAAASQPFIDALTLTKTPYNVNALSQFMGLSAIKRTSEVNAYVTSITQRREVLKIALESFGYTVYDSAANFLFMPAPAESFLTQVNEKGFLIRPFMREKLYVRITVGSAQETTAFIHALKEINHVI